MSVSLRVLLLKALHTESNVCRSRTELLARQETTTRHTCFGGALPRSNMSTTMPTSSHTAHSRREIISMHTSNVGKPVLSSTLFWPPRLLASSSPAQIASSSAPIRKEQSLWHLPAQGVCQATNKSTAAKGHCREPPAIKTCCAETTEMRTKCDTADAAHKVNQAGVLDNVLKFTTVCSGNELHSALRYCPSCLCLSFSADFIDDNYLHG